MRPLSFEPKDKQRHERARFSFFDFKTYVDEETGRLIPNMPVVQDDRGVEVMFPAEDELFGRDISDDLCQYIFRKEHGGYYVLAHNFRVSPTEPFHNRTFDFVYVCSLGGFFFICRLLKATSC